MSDAIFKLFVLLLFVTFLPLAACGIKPDKLKAPEGSENTDFPRTYPDPSTDPQAK